MNTTEENPYHSRLDITQVILLQWAEKAANKAMASAQEERKQAETIHTIRKSIKKMRAYWRLLAVHLPKAKFRKENRRLRDAGRKLSRFRDWDVAVELLEELAVRSGGEKCPLILSGLYTL